MPDFRRARDAMVEMQLAGRGIRDARLLDAMRQVPREAFVEPGLEDLAYEDGPLPIGAGQTISQPYMVAMMLEAAAVGPRDRVLEVGSGSGYAVAVLSRIAARVYGIERHAELAAAAERRLAALDYRNVELRVGDGTRGWPEAAPFDAVLVSAGAPRIPPELRAQLAVGGRLVVPVGPNRRRQILLRILRRTATEFEEQDLGDVRFVPLVGEHGWSPGRGRLR